MTRISVLTRGVLGALLVVATAPAVHAQASDTTMVNAKSAMDSVFARARQLVIAGQTAAGRQIVDSVLAATPEGTPAYGAALYGKAMVEPTAADAQRDYQQIVVEYPLSAHAGDALLQLAQLERSQGNRDAAITHLQRFLRENPMSADRAKTGFWLAQLLFEENKDMDACGVLNTARAAVPTGDVELINRMNFYSGRCDAAVAQAHADSVARADSLRADSVARAEAARRAAEKKHAAERKKEKPAASTRRTRASSGDYAVQVGAFATKSEAEKMVSRLHGRGLEARIDGTRKPYRVRVGHYRTHAEASRALTRFKKMGIAGFVTNTGGR